MSDEVNTSKQADKSSGLVVMDTTDYKQEINKQLLNTSYLHSN